MLKAIGLALGLLCLLAGLPAHAGGQISANCSWNCAWAPSSASDQALAGNQALIDLQLRNGILNPGTSSQTSNTYNGTVNQTYTGPNSNSGSSVMNIDNLNSTTVNTSAKGSTVNVTTSTTQKADGSTQSGSAKSNAATNGNLFDANNTISTGH